MSSRKNAISPTRGENFAEWYQEVIKAADLAEHSAVRGCMIIKPNGYAIWEMIQKVLDKKIKDTGHQNVYFPLLIPLSFLEKEAAHVEGFAKECAIVTHYRLETDGEGKLIPSPNAELTEPLIIRPTSETIIGNAMAKWVQSYKDLPLLYNQWCNVMRWEMRTRLFLRTSEFLWQEGHTAHASEQEAVTETLTMLDVYEELATQYLAMPVIKGEKTASERFPGAVNTYCIEAMMQDKKALQAGTSHFLGRNFSTAYEIKFLDKNQELSYVWTTSWGVSTRLIGGLIMTHSDDDGLVLPPRIAPDQVILIPVVMNENDKQQISDFCDQLAKDLRSKTYQQETIRVAIDKTDRKGSEKFWTAVKRGVPLRVEIGKREIESGNLAVSRRDKEPKDKQSLARETFLSEVENLLTDIQQNLYDRALTFREQNTREITSLIDLHKMFDGGTEDATGFASVYLDPAVESDPYVVEKLQSMKLTIRCIPFHANSNPKGECIFSGSKNGVKVFLAKAY